MEPTQAFTLSMYHAVWRDLRYDGREANVRVLTAYTETFGSTALGWGGMAGQAMTTALTVAIVSNDKIAVYRNARLDYIVENPSREFMMRIQERRIPSHVEWERSKTNLTES